MRSASLTIKVLLFSLIMVLLFFPTSFTQGQATSGTSLWPTTFAAGETAQRPWSVWRRRAGCAGSRNDWMTVSQDYPGGLGWLPAQASHSHPTFAAAMAELDMLRLTDCPAETPACNSFRNDCCKMDVFQNPSTKAFTVVNAGDNPGPGVILVRSRLCCEDAALLSGIALPCLDLKLASVPGAIVRKTHSGFVSLAGPITIPSTPPIVIPSLSPTGGGGGWRPINNQAGLTGERLTSYRGTTAEQCQADCAKNPQCKGYTLIRAGAYNPNDPPMCYLMSSVKDYAPSPCCISGIKSESGGGGRSSNDCGCKDRCPECEGVMSLLCVINDMHPKAQACRQCMQRNGCR